MSIDPHEVRVDSAVETAISSYIKAPTCLRQPWSPNGCSPCYSISCSHPGNYLHSPGLSVLLMLLFLQLLCWCCRAGVGAAVVVLGAAALLPCRCWCCLTGASNVTSVR